jgi:hypothetical protein
VSIDESAGRELGSCGVQRSNGFQYASEDGLDWSVMTTEPIQEASPVLFIPNEMILSSTRARQELGTVEAAVGQLNRLGASDQVSEFCLFVKILAEYENGDQSPWFPWLNSLPRLFYNAVSMTSEYSTVRMRRVQQMGGVDTSNSFEELTCSPFCLLNLLRFLLRMPSSIGLFPD